MRGKLRSVAQVKAEKRKVWKKWDQMDGHGTQKRGIYDVFRLLIYRFVRLKIVIVSRLLLNH